MSIRHLLATPRHAQLELSSSFAPLVSATLSLYSLILALPVKVFSISFLIRSRHSFLCGLIVSSTRCHLCTTRRTSSVDHEPQGQQTTRKIFLAQFAEFFPLGTQVRKMRSYFENEQSIFALLALHKSVFEIVPVSMFTTNSDNCLFLFMLHIRRQLDLTDVPSCCCRVWDPWSAEYQSRKHAMLL